MPYQKFNSANNANCLLDLPISNSDTTLIAKWNYDRFPTANFIIKVTEYDANQIVIGRENMLIATRSGSVFTVAGSWRAYEAVPMDDAASTNIIQALPFSTNSVIECIMSVAFIDDVRDEVTRLETAKLSVSDYQNWTKVYAATSTWTDAYAIALSPVPSAYLTGMTFKFQADVANTGAATLDVNGLGVKTIKKQNNIDLETGDIEAGQLVIVSYDGTHFQMMSPSAKVIDLSAVEPRAIYDSTYVVGEELEVEWLPVFIENSPSSADATFAQNIWDVASNTRISFPIFGSGIAATTLNLILAKFGSPSVDLWIRIEEDDGSGSPSGTLVDPNATETIAPWSLTVSLADTICTLAGSITLQEWQKCHIVVFQWTYGSETVNGSNYYKIGYDDVNTTTRMGKYWNGSAWWNGLSANEAHADSLVNGGSTAQSKGYKIKALKNLSLSTVTKHTSVAWSTRCKILADDWTLIRCTYSLSGDVYTFSPAVTLVWGLNYRVEIDDHWDSYTDYEDTTPTLSTKDNIEYTWLGSIDGSDSVNVFNVASIQTVALSIPFPYTSSDLFLDRVLSECDSDFSYKVTLHGISQEIVTSSGLATGKKPKLITWFVDEKQVDMTQWDVMYIGKKYTWVSDNSTIAQATNNYTTGTYSTFGNSASSLAYAGQEFTTVTDFILREITIPLRKTWSPTDNVVMKLYKNDKTTLIATSETVFSWTVLTTSYADFTFVFPDLALEAGVQYFIEMSRSWALDISNVYHWGGNTAWGYAWGTLWYWSSTKWNQIVGEDHTFSIQMGTGTRRGISDTPGAISQKIGKAIAPTKIELIKFLPQEALSAWTINIGNGTFNLSIPHGLWKIPRKLRFDFSVAANSIVGIWIEWNQVYMESRSTETSWTWYILKYSVATITVTSVDEKYVNIQTFYNTTAINVVYILLAE